MRLLRTLALTAVLLVATTTLAATLAKPRIIKRQEDGQAEVRLEAPPRFMWGWGDGLRGYCGETSLQTFGLMFGNYITSESARFAADGRELLIGVNEEVAANKLRFKYQAWDYEKYETPQAPAFLSWVADHIDDGHGVIAGFFEQVNGGDPDYDHIMPIVGYLSNALNATEPKRPVGAKAGAKVRTDVAGIYYNDLYRKDSLYGSSGTFVRNRDDCDAPNGIQPLAAPYEFCLPKKYDYGIAIMGNRDDADETYPAHLAVSSWTEPDYGFEDQIHAPVVTFKATLTVSGLKAGTKYAVLRFDHADFVPVSEFLRGSFAKRFDFTAENDTKTLTEFDSFPSDSTVFYRVVRS